jgi:hypothetical protein
MKKRILCLIVAFALAFSTAAVLTGCGGTKWNVTFSYINTGMPDFSASSVVVTVRDGETVTPPTPVQAVQGWEFDDWFTQSVGGSPANFTNITAHTTFFARYKRSGPDYNSAIDITTPAELREIDLENPDAVYRLAANMMLANWEPLGSSDEPFRGTFFMDPEDGFEITAFTMGFDNLTQNASGDFYAGIFAVNRGLIENITIRNLSFNINGAAGAEHVRGRTFAGAFAGDNRGTIYNCNVVDGSITVTVNDSSGSTSRLRVGMLAGRNNGNASGTRGVIRNSQATGNISTTSAGNNNRTGGLVGVNSGGTILNSFAGVNLTLNTTLNGNPSGGGLIGYAEGGGIIRESFATGNISSASAGGGTSYAGGLIGNLNAQDPADTDWEAEEDRWQFEITDSFATGNAWVRLNISRNGYAGGLIARVDNSKETEFCPDVFMDILVKNCYATGTVSLANDTSTTPNNRHAAGLVGRIQLQSNGTLSSTAFLRNNFVANRQNTNSQIPGTFSITTPGRGGFISATNPVNNLQDNPRGITIEYSTPRSVSWRMPGITTHGGERFIDFAGVGTATGAWIQNTLEWSAEIWDFAGAPWPTLRNAGVK